MPKLSLAKLERHLYSAADRLRQEGLDAATYKDYIFGMLFLKRSSDVFDAEREKVVGDKVAQGVIKEKAESEYGENPDFYDEFFVPERARWSYLQDKLGDAKEPYGGVLDKALAALAEHNDSLEHVLDHISFMRVQSNKRIVSDDACKDLVRHFSKYRLRNEDFQFSDLLGSAYEFLINMFAESAGKKGGDFYTPRDVIRLMVRILKPKPGLSVYDPCCGSGGMLIISREFVEQSGGDPTNIRLCGQVNDSSAWSICKLNMLLHCVPGADIQLQDTLLHPAHREGGELERFDRVIANPPFSQNYTKSNMEYPERNVYVTQQKKEELSAHSVVSGDVLITKMGIPPCIAAVYPDSMPSGVITADVIRVRPRIDIATPFWLTIFVNSPRFAAWVRKITGGVTRPKVTLADFRNLPLLLPCVTEQHRIESVLTTFSRELFAAQRELQKSIMLKSGLMNDLLTGRVRVPEAIAVTG